MKPTINNSDINVLLKHYVCFLKLMFSCKHTYPYIYLTYLHSREGRIWICTIGVNLILDFSWSTFFFSMVAPWIVSNYWNFIIANKYGYVLYRPCRISPPSQKVVASVSGLRSTLSCEGCSIFISHFYTSQGELRGLFCFFSSQIILALIRESLQM